MVTQHRKCFQLLGLSLAVCFLSGCLAYNITQLKDVSSEEAIAVAKFRIVYNGEDVTKGSFVIFNAPDTGFVKYQFMLDETGYLFAKLPVGVNRIRFINHRSGFMQHHFGPEELTCQLSGSGVINYIGDITAEWKGKGTGSAFAITAATGVFAQALFTQGKIRISVEANTAKTQEIVARKFATSKSITPALLAVKPNN